MATSDADRGQAAVLVLTLAAVLFVVVAAALVEVGSQLIERTRAQIVADAAALSSLQVPRGAGRSAARAMAERHAAELVDYRLGPDEGQVIVVVRVGGATATAAASEAP